MNKIFLLMGILLISLTSCKDKEIENLRIENERLRNENFQQTQTVYVWTVIECKICTYVEYGYGSNQRKGLEDIKSMLFWSEIEEVMNFNKDVKYRLQDELENKCRQRYVLGLHSIQNRETFIFNTYAEASQFKDNVINGNR